MHYKDVLFVDKYVCYIMIQLHYLLFYILDSSLFQSFKSHKADILCLAVTAVSIMYQSSSVILLNALIMLHVMLIKIEKILNM